MCHCVSVLTQRTHQHKRRPVTYIYVAFDVQRNGPFVSKEPHTPTLRENTHKKNQRAMSVLSVHLSPEHGFSKTSQPSIKLLKGLGVEGDCHLGKTTQHLWRLKSHASEPNLRQVHLIQSELLDEPDFHGDDGVQIQPGQMGENVSTIGIDLLSLSNGTKLHFVDKEHSQAAFDGRYYRVFNDLSVVFLKHLIVKLFIDAIAMTMGYSSSWYGMAPVVADSLNKSFLVYHVGFWPILAFEALYMASGVDRGFHTVMVGTMACLNLIILAYVCCANDYFGEHAVIRVTGVRHPCKKVDMFRSGLKEKCVVRGEEKNKIIKRKAGIMAVVTRAGTVKPGMTIIAETTWRFKELPVLA